MGKQKDAGLVKELAEQARKKAEADEATIRQQRSDIRRLEKQLGYWEAFFSELGTHVQALPLPKKPTLRGKPAGRSHELVAVLSDCHANETWTADQVDGTSYYNFERFCEHLWYYGEELIRIAEEDRGRHGLKVLHVDILGDIIHGALRVEDEVTNDFPTVPALANTTWVLWQWLRLLSEYFLSIECVCMPGNHGRLHQKPQAKRYVDENHDTLIYKMLEKFADVAGAGSRVRFTVPRSRVYTHTRLGHRIKLGHGCHIRGGNSIANLPIYGLSRELLRQFRKDIVAKHTEGLALVTYGHFHNSNWLESTLLLNGPMCPTGPWAFDNLGAAAEPKQWVYYTSREYAIGWMTDLALKHAPKKHGFVYDKSVADTEDD